MSRYCVLDASRSIDLRNISLRHKHYSLHGQTALFFLKKTPPPYQTTPIEGSYYVQKYA